MRDRYNGYDFNQDLGDTDSPTFAGNTITGCSVFGLNSAVFQPTTDSTTAVQMLQANDTVGFNYDSTNNRIGLGIASPSAHFHLVSSTETTFYFDAYSTTNSLAPNWRIRKSASGSIGTAAKTADGETLGSITVLGCDNGNVFDRGFELTVTQNGASGSRVPTDVKFETYTNSAKNTNQFFLSNNSNVGIGDAAPGEKLDVAGNINVTGVYKVDDVQVVSNRVVDVRCDDTINSGDATTDGVIDALRDAMITHGLIAAS